MAMAIHLCGFRSLFGARHKISGVRGDSTKLVGGEGGGYGGVGGGGGYGHDYGDGGAVAVGLDVEAAALFADTFTHAGQADSDVATCMHEIFEHRARNSLPVIANP